jgi:AbrB family looped-hinge helix DNA binding protein
MKAKDGVVMENPIHGTVSQVKVDSAGRVVIPAVLRDKLGIAPGQELILKEEVGGLRLQTFEQAARAIQAEFARYAKPDVSVVEELILERREEATREYDR